jgi:hypothetical protein
MSLKGLQKDQAERRIISTVHKVSLDVSTGPVEVPSRKKSNMNSCHQVSIDVSPEKEELHQQLS